MGARRFQDLVAWQLARELRRSVRPLWQRAAELRDYDFRDQLRAAARSATANIAEGFPCSHLEFARFLEVSMRSVREIEDRIDEAIDSGMAEVEELERPVRLVKRLTKASSRLRAYLLSTPDPATYKPRRPRRPGVR